MAEIKIPDIDYTSRDWLSIRNDLISRIQFFNPEWTDHNETDLGITLIELFAYVADVLHFYIDRRSAEGFLPTAVSKQSIINLLKLIDYSIPGPTSATVDLTFTLDGTKTTDVLIPAGVKVQTLAGANENSVVFETAEDLIIPAGNLSGTVGAEEGETFEETPEPSNGAAFQKIILSRESIAENSVRVYVKEFAFEELWTRVSSFANSSGTDKVYVLSTDENGVVSIEFGDNGQGKIPEPGATFRIVYKTTFGSQGNVGANTIVQVLSTVLHQGSPLSLTVSNASPATGGSDGQSIEEAKRLGPLTLRTLNRAITLEDIATLAKQVEGVAKAKAENRFPVINREIDLYVAPQGGGVPSSLLLSNVLDYLEDKKIAGMVIYANPPKYIKININANIVVKANYLQSDVIDAVNESLDNFFSFENIDNDFGTPIYLSDTYCLIKDVDGVQSLILNEFHLDPIDTINYKLWSGDSTISEINLSRDAKEEVITITFFSQTQFTVVGSVSGAQTNIGTVDILYVMDNNELSFKITSGSLNNKSGDIAEFRSVPLLGDVFLQQNEIRQKGVFTLNFSGGS